MTGGYVISQLSCLLLFSALFPGNVLAASAGELGNQLRQMQPQTIPAPAPPDVSLSAGTQGDAKAPADDGTRVTLSRVIFDGAPFFPGKTGKPVLTPLRLQKIAEPWLNKPLSFADLQALTDAVTSEYRQRGVLLARAVLPPQTVKSGTLTIKVLPGRYDTARISNSSSLRNTAVERILSATAPVGQVVLKNDLERTALLLSEIPGVTSRVSLTSGNKAGTTAPDITVEQGKRLSGYLGLDNQGDPATGRSRVLGGAVINNLTGLGDQLRFDALGGYEQSNLFTGSLDYSLPAGGRGTRLGGSYSHLNYRYDFMRKAYRGYSDNLQLYVTHPWVRTSQARVDVRLDVGRQYLTDKYPFALQGGESAKGYKIVTQGNLGVTGSAALIPESISGFGLQGTFGKTDYRNEVARQIAFSREADSIGAFFRMNWQLSHDQQIWGPLSVYARLNGQQSNHNLDSSQKFLLGGPATVRAYDIGQGAVDKGTIGTLELRGRWLLSPVWRLPGTQPDLTVAAFYDQGWGEQYKSNNNATGPGKLTEHNRVNLSGAGLYATLADRNNYALTITWAQRTGEKDPVSGRSDRDQFWISAVKMF
ncbi:ShlB/FhaC/HecB family hemolysin secretion/activation protein [Morganella morganii]|uniref:ShlB/FhaC/HecB family hemolysin secretion/activation protein n=2 Tax=Morganella morganii TaxID=582 RepID=A0A8I0PZ54_MORMO|nr:ShlB/FhaC/HecB family hemolysin secretion/activation protein [Morganella morganii]